jgi:DNA invertase Pin-like site-specific DNA recombinase
MKVAYKRVSTTDQSTGRQLDGVQVDKVFEDQLSGKDTNRPQLQAALEFCREGDVLIVHSMDRLARNLADLLSIVERLNKKRVTVRFEKENLTFSADTSDAMATLMLQLLGSFAQFERSLIRERQKEGIALAKQRGAYTGRKRALSAEQAAQLKTRAAAGESKSALAEQFNISRESVYTYLRT